MLVVNWPSGGAASATSFQEPPTRRWNETVEPVGCPVTSPRAVTVARAVTGDAMAVAAGRRQVNEGGVGLWRPATGWASAAAAQPSRGATVRAARSGRGNERKVTGDPRLG